ncbi:hypothetical protein QZM62_27765 [Burkholderia multivorans]|nr:hypothetical protein [Burkholderia multivorans]
MDGSISTACTQSSSVDSAIAAIGRPCRRAERVSGPHVAREPAQRTVGKLKEIQFSAIEAAEIRTIEAVRVGERPDDGKADRPAVGRERASGAVIALEVVERQQIVDGEATLRCAAGEGGRHAGS